jgi:hypothetical protein
VENTDVTSALKDAIGSVLEEVRKVPPVQTQNPTQHVVIQSADPPKPEPKMAWIAATAALVSVLVAIGAVLFAMDARGEMRANNSNRENDIRELRQADNAFRAYINTGRVPVKQGK